MSIVPRNLGKLTDWVGLQLRKRPAYAETLKLSTDEVAALTEADNEALRYCQEAADALTAAAARVAARDAYLKTYNQESGATIARFKTNPAYTLALGKDCEWLDEATPVDPSTLQPTLKHVFSPEGIRLDWSKNGQDGVDVFRRQAGDTAWTKLAFDSRSPYIDTETGLSGPYEYYVQLLKADKMVGRPSDIVSALHG